MILLDKLKSMFLEEESEDEIIDDDFDELEPEKPVVKEEKVEHKDHSDIFKKPPMNNTTNPGVYPEEKEVGLEEKVEGIKKFDIKADNLKSMPKEEKKPVVQQRRSSLEKREYDIPEVVSPIFGLNEEDMKKWDEKKVVRQTKSSRHSGFGEVISPYFGDTSSEEKVSDDISNEEIIIDTNKTDSNYQSRHELVDDEDIENISLKNMIDDNDEGLIQFSLFGSDKVIKEEEYTRELNLKDAWKKENEDE